MTFTSDGELVFTGIQNTPQFGQRAVYLDDANVPGDLPGAQELLAYRTEGIRIVAPPMWALLTARTAASSRRSTRRMRTARLDIITWTLERSGRIVEEVLPTKGTASPSFYYQTTLASLGQSPTASGRRTLARLSITS